MAAALIVGAVHSLVIGSIGYGVCQGFNHSNPFEKAVLVTVQVGLRNLAAETIKHLRSDKDGVQPLTCVLIHATHLVAIPCSLYAGRVFKFKEDDYLQIVGLLSLGYTITYCLKSLYSMLYGKKPTIT